MKRTGIRSRGRVSRVGRWFAAMIAVGASAPAIASATDYTVNDDTSGSGPAGSHCATPDFSAIEAGINAAAASGDRLLVCDGTYTEPDNQILITKSIAIIGNGVGNSIIDGQDATGMPSAGLIRTTDSTNGDVTIKGFTVKRAGQSGTGATTARFAFNLLGNDPGFTYLVEDVDIIGRGSGGRDYGFYGQNADQDVVLRNSTLEEQAYNPILIERVNGHVTIESVEIDKPSYNTSASIFAFTHSNDAVSNRWTFKDNTIHNNGVGGALAVQTGLAGGGANPATLGPVTISGNELDGYATGGIGVINTSSSASGTNGQISDVTIEDNKLTPAVATSTGIRIQGLVSDVTATGNSITGTDRAIGLEAGPGGHVPADLTATFNRLAGNTTGLQNATATPVSAENNWWGCNAGPADNSDGCSPVVDSTPDSTDFDPWMVLGVTAAPTSIETGGQTSTVSLSLAKNSDGATPAGNVLPGPFDVAMSTDLGTIAPPTVTLDGNYEGTATLTSGATAGTATVTAALDAASPTAQVEFTQQPTPPVVVNDCANPAQGTNGPDVFTGTSEEDGYVGLDGDDQISGQGGDDCLNGQGGDDEVRGQGGDDVVNGGGGDDDVRGGAGDDELRGFGGDDTVQGGAGNDDVRGGNGEDLVRGGGGEDTLNTRDKFADEVRCGGGDDVALVDRRDEVAKNCEVVKVG